MNAVKSYYVEENIQQHEEEESQQAWVTFIEGIVEKTVSGMTKVFYFFLIPYFIWFAIQAITKF